MRDDPGGGGEDLRRRAVVLLEAVERQRPAIRPVAGLARRHLVRGEPLVLPALDDPEQRARRPAPLVDVGGGDQLLQEALLVVAVENREVRPEANRLGVTAQDASG